MHFPRWSTFRPPCLMGHLTARQHGLKVDQLGKCPIRQGGLAYLYFTHAQTWPSVHAPPHPAERTHILLLNPTFWLFMFQLLYPFKGQLHNDLNQADLASVAALTAIHFHLIVNKRRKACASHPPSAPSNPPTSRRSAPRRRRCR